MKKVLIFAALAEAATGLALLVVPSPHRCSHTDSARDWHALIALAVACWPGPPLVGMLIYSALVTLYLAYLGLAGG